MGRSGSADVFVLPTHQESFGFAIVEALSCGSPVVITDKTNIAPIIKRHSAGIVGTDSAKSTLASLNKWFSLRLRALFSVGGRVDLGIVGEGHVLRPLCSPGAGAVRCRPGAA